MKKREPIIFEACLQQSTPGAKPLKFDAEGAATIIFEADASQMEKVKRLVGQYQILFKISLEVIG